MKTRLLIALSIGHLVLVGFGAAEFDWRRVKHVGGAIQMYGGATGAGSGYGFFAPGVGTQLRATFEISKADGTTVVESLRPGEGRETELRTSNIISVFWEQIEDERGRRAFAASWAGKVLSRHPDAGRVKVKLEAYELPDMAGYAKGDRPMWAPFYDATFERSSRIAQGD